MAIRDISALAVVQYGIEELLDMFSMLSLSRAMSTTTMLVVHTYDEDFIFINVQGVTQGCIVTTNVEETPDILRT